MMYSSLPASVAPNFASSASQSSFAVFYVHIHITQTSIKNTQNTTTENSSVFLELILSLLRLSSSRRTITNFPHTHGLKPELALDLPSLKAHTTSELFRFHCISITSHS